MGPSQVAVWQLVRALELGAFIVGNVSEDTARIVFPGIEAHVDIWVSYGKVLFTRAVVLGTECHNASALVSNILDEVLDLPHVSKTLNDALAQANPVRA